MIRLHNKHVKQKWIPKVCKNYVIFNNMLRFVLNLKQSDEHF